MSQRESGTRRSWIDLASAVAISAVALFSLQACDSKYEDPTPTGPAIYAQNEVVSDPEGEGGEGGGGAETLVLPGQYRKCDGKFGVYTVEGNSGVGYGEGRTRQEAEDAAVRDAIEDDLFDQFKCQQCDDGVRCDKYSSTIRIGAASMDDPDNDCEDIDGRWYCFGDVSLNPQATPPAAGAAGCRTCPDGTQPVNPN